MRRAGVQAFAHISRRYQQARRVLILAGKGNNGGDAWVVAGAAAGAGWVVDLWQVTGTVAELDGEAGAARDWAFAQGLPQQSVHQQLPGDQEFRVPAPHEAVVVDGMLGTGLASAPRPAVTQAIEWLNQLGLPCVALDLPSGVNADSGATPGVAVQAALTVTFINMKLGLLTGQGVACAGDVVLEELGVDSQRLARAAGIRGWPVFADSVAPMPAREPTAYKNNFGHIVVLAGDSGGGGAAMLAAEAALRSGAGLVSVGTRAEHVAPLLTRCPELMARDIAGQLAAEELLQRASVVVVGPGLGQAAWGQQLYAAVLRAAEAAAATTPLGIVIDADALNLIAAGAAVPANAVLTPHPGEAARLLDCSTADIAADRIAAVREIAQRYHCVAVLKGAGTLVADNAGLASVCALGNPGMATAGMGDTLAGIIAGVVAQQSSGSYWVGRAVQLHAAAGDLAAARLGEASLLASDVIAALPQALGASGQAGFGGSS